MRIISFVSIGLLLLLTACISEKSVTNKYYIIGVYKDQPNLQNRTFIPIQGSCEIEQIEISPVYESNQIVNRSDSHEVTYYKYHLWAARPSVSITEFINNYLDSAGIFQSVSVRYSRAIPNFRFSTYIHQMEVIESSGVFSAHLNIEYRIIDISTNHVLLQHEADRTESLSSKDLNLFARAVSNILLSELQAFTYKIDANRSKFERENE